MKRFIFLLSALFFLTSCGGSSSSGMVNPNFSDVSDSRIQPSLSVESNNTDQVVVVDQGGRIGSVPDQNKDQILCVIIDPAPEDDADLEVCDASQADQETNIVTKICPQETTSSPSSRCSSRKTGSGPDFCQVTGARDYVFVIVNVNNQSVAVAYQVVSRPCADLGITEETIQADDPL